jgi:hypothetical protein
LEAAAGCLRLGGCIVLVDARFSTVARVILESAYHYGCVVRRISAKIFVRAPSTQAQ